MIGLLPLFGVPGFYRFGNLRNLAIDNLPTLVAAIGMTVVIVVAEIDISIGSLFAVCGALAGLAAKAGWPMALVVPATLAAGAALGAVNGLLVTRARVPSIIATLATMAIVRNGIIRATGGAWIQDLPSGFQWFGLGQAAAQPPSMPARRSPFSWRRPGPCAAPPPAGRSTPSAATMKRPGESA